MSMNETIRETMRQELAKSRDGLGLGVGVVCFFGLCALIGAIPSLAAFVKDHGWLYLVIIILSLGAGGITGSLREDALRREIGNMDDDTLKFRHERMSRKQQRSTIVLYLIVALVAAYFIFRN